VWNTDWSLCYWREETFRALVTDWWQTGTIAPACGKNGVSIATGFPRGANSDANRTTPRTAVSVYCEGGDY
jgi:hypothetical protein